MAGRLKHMERSYSSYKDDREAIFVGFHNKAHVKASHKTMQKSGFLESVRAGIRKMFHCEQSR